MARGGGPLGVLPNRSAPRNSRPTTTINFAREICPPRRTTSDTWPARAKPLKGISTSLVACLRRQNPDRASHDISLSSQRGDLAKTTPSMERRDDSLSEPVPAYRPSCCTQRCPQTGQKATLNVAHDERAHDGLYGPRPVRRHNAADLSSLWSGVTESGRLRHLGHLGCAFDHNDRFAPNLRPIDCCAGCLSTRSHLPLRPPTSRKCDDVASTGHQRPFGQPDRAHAEARRAPVRGIARPEASAPLPPAEPAFRPEAPSDVPASCLATAMPPEQSPIP